MHHVHSKATFILQATFPWAYATLGERMGAACLEALATHAQEQLPRFTAQNLANMMWAFAKLNYSPDATLLLSCEAQGTRIAGTMDPQELVRHYFLVYIKSVDRVFEVPLCQAILLVMIRI